MKISHSKGKQLKLSLHNHIMALIFNYVLVLLARILLSLSQSNKLKAKPRTACLAATWRFLNYPSRGKPTGSPHFICHN